MTDEPKGPVDVAAAASPAPDHEAVKRRRERVLSILERTPGFMAIDLLAGFCEGNVSRAGMTYEDWACPVTASAGEVCLVADLERATIWWTVNRSDWLEAVLEGRFYREHVEGPEAVGYLRVVVQLDVLEPVPREETPFAEGTYG